MDGDYNAVGDARVDSGIGHTNHTTRREHVAANRRPEGDVALVAAIQEYLRALRNGKQPNRRAAKAWEEFFLLYDPLVLQIVAGCHVHESDTEDCVQDVWTELCRALIDMRYDPLRGCFEGWLRQVIRRSVLRSLRRLRHATLHVDGSISLEELCDPTAGPQAVCLSRELCRSVRRLLVEFRRSVSATTYRVFYLASVKGCPVSEISEQLDLSAAQIYTRHHRAKCRFRRLFKAS